MFDIIASVLTGGATGILGSLIGTVGRFLEKKQKLKEITDRSAKEEAEKIPKFIRDRRAELDLASFDTNSFLHEVSRITTLQERELIPFLLEKTKKIPSALKRPDLQEMIKDKETVARLKPVVKAFRKRYNELWNSRPSTSLSWLGRISRIM